MVTNADSVRRWQVAVRFLFGLLVGLEIGWLWPCMLFSLNVAHFYMLHVEGKNLSIIDELVKIHNRLEPLEFASSNWGFRIAMFLWIAFFGSLIFHAIL